ncbi:nitrate reductase [Alcanivorax sp. N3-2A]|nr:nitrate reductase [Alcanivorax sp. N3-2A]|tara:strand:+ start:114396 stop:117014 length:2619 start_codon:yes stop_codon:yes gene_type:complete
MRQTIPHAGEPVRSTCPYCGVGCGLISDGDNLRGDPDHPANRGRLCVKGSSLLETLGEHGRLLSPRIGDRTVSWERALDEVAERFRRVIDEHGPDAVALYVSGQLLTEDYYVANKLMKGFIGSANIDTNSRLCMSSAVVAHKRAFGEDVVPGCYQDLELADLVVLTGSNTAWAHPIVYQRLAAEKKRRPAMKIVVIDPRRTATCDLADLHLPIRPGQDVALFNGLLAWLDQHQAVDRAYLEAHTRGFDATLAQARDGLGSWSGLAAQLGLAQADLECFYQWFAATGRTVTLFSQGINQARNGTDQGNAIINAHLATGRVGRPGAGPFSITGQPNAMGGREVGGLANQLAVHLELDNPAHHQAVADFWGAPALARRPGLMAVDLFRAIEAGTVKAVWIIATNPVDSLPEADRVRAALRACDTVVVSDCVSDTDTLECADIALPALAWGEKDGTVTNSERVISRQRSFLAAPGEARPDWWALCQVAKRLGFADAFDYRHPAQIFREYAAMTGLARRFGKCLDLTAAAALTDSGYQQWTPRRWPFGESERCFSDARFSTADGRARLIPCAPPPAECRSAELPLTLNSGRLRDQWHTMTRTGRAPMLFSHRDEPFVEIAPLTAARFGLEQGGYARVRSAAGEALVKVRFDDGLSEQALFMPLHWTDRFTGRARVDALVPALTDPHSGQPAFKHTPAMIQPWQPRWHGLLLGAMAAPAVDYWARVPVDAHHWRYQLAGQAMPDETTFMAWLPEAEHWLSLDDSAAGHHRRVALDRHNRIIAWLALAPEPVHANLEWLAGCLAQPVADGQRAGLLLGDPGDGGVDLGVVVCTCFQVREGQLRAAVEQGARTVSELGLSCRAGTNCGSCIPELKRFVAD